MSAPVIWILFPIGLSIILLLLRRNYLLTASIQIFASLILGISAVFSTIDQVNRKPFQVLVVDPIFFFLGRSLVIDSGVKAMTLILYFFLGAWTAALYLFKVKSKIVPLGLTFVALLISSLSVEPFLYSALILEIAVIVSVIMVSDSNSPSKKGSLRYLIYYSIGMPFILLAGWYLAGGEITPVNEVQLIQATLLLGLGFVFWLGVFPFQSWIPLIAEENRPTESMFLLILIPVVIIVLLLKYLNGFVWLREYSVVFQAIRLFGLIMVVTGSLWAFFQKKINRLVGYLLIVSTGLTLLSIGVNSSSGFMLSSFFIFARLSIFFSFSWILFLLTREQKNQNLDLLTSLFKVSPFLGLGLLITLFSIAGMPFTISFPLYQGLFAFLSADYPALNNLVVLSIGMISIVFIRLSFLIFRNNVEPNLFNLSFYEKAFLTFSVFLLIAVGFFPGFFFPGFGGIVNGYEFLVK